MTIGVIATPQTASADIITMDWGGYFHMLSPEGGVLSNGSLWTKGTNQYETPITGTLTWDTLTINPAKISICYAA